MTDERTSNTVPLPEGRIARRYRIRLTNTVVHTVYESTTLALDAPQGSRHGTITHINEVCLGRLVSRDLPPELQALPVGETRSLAVRARYRELYAESERLLRQAFPYLVEAPVDWIDGDGEVPVTWSAGDAEVHSAQLAARTDRIDREQA
ncbi:MAG: hypothetical protein WCI67_21010 [Chloroflexales bacterium]